MQYSIGYLPNRYGVTDTLIIWNHFATVMNFSFLLRIGENSHTQRSLAPSQLTPQPTRPELTWWSFSFYQKTSKVPHQTLFTAKTSEWQKGQIWQSSGCCGADSQIYKCQVQLEAAKKTVIQVPFTTRWFLYEFSSIFNIRHSLIFPGNETAVILLYFFPERTLSLFLSCSTGWRVRCRPPRRAGSWGRGWPSRPWGTSSGCTGPCSPASTSSCLEESKEMNLSWYILFHQITHTNHYPSTKRMHAIVEVEDHL